MLISQAECLSLLRCPATDTPLTRLEDGFASVNGLNPRKYSVVEGKPILILHEDSIVDEKTLMQRVAASPISRSKRGGLRTLVRMAVSPTSRITEKNIEHLVSRLTVAVRKPRVLVIGGGTIGQGTELLYTSSEISVVAFDVYNSPHVQFLADAHRLPMASETFDGVVVQAVLEHVLCPERVVSEIRRVLKPNGLLYAETPFMQQVHEGPYDFTRYTVNGHRWLFRYFKQGSAGVVLGPATQLVWSLEHFARALFRSKALGRLVRLLFSWLRIFDAMMPDSKKEDGACGIYFLGEKSEKALAPVELVNYYNSRHRL